MLVPLDALHRLCLEGENTLPDCHVCCAACFVYPWITAYSFGSPVREWCCRWWSSTTAPGNGFGREAMATAALKLVMRAFSINAILYKKVHYCTCSAGQHHVWLPRETRHNTLSIPLNRFYVAPCHTSLMLHNPAPCVMEKVPANVVVNSRVKPLRCLHCLTAGNRLCSCPMHANMC